MAEAAPSAGTGAGAGAYAGLRVLDLTHVIAGPMCTKLLAEHGADVDEDPELVRCGVLQPVEIPGHGAVRIPVAPHHLDGAPVAVTGPPPRLGQHTRQVLAADLGLGAQAIAELLAAGTVHDSKAVA